MALVQIPISKGVFRTPSARSLRNSEFCEHLTNLLIDQAGANVDRPTLTEFSELSSTEPIGSYWFANRLVFVTLDRKIFAVDTAGAVTDITGVSLPGTKRPTFTDNGTTLFIVGGGTPIKWKGVGTTTVALGGSPPAMTHIVYLDGYLMGNRQIVSENNKVIQFSEYEDEETWTGTDIFSAVADPDEVRGLAVSQRELFVVGQKTTEIWQNIGSYPIPFSRAFVWQYGTPAPYSITSADNSVFFLDQDHRIIRIVGRTPVRLSEAIEDDLFSYETVTDCWSGSFTWKGSIHVLFVFPTAEKAWSIDLKNGQWSEWMGYENGFSRLRLNCLHYVEDSGAIYGGDYATGKIWKFSATEKTDAGGVFKRRRTFGYWDGGASVRKQTNLVRVNLERNVAAEYEGEESDTNPKLELRWKDDGKPWTDFRKVSLGEIGEQRHYAEFRRLGIYRSRKYELQMSDPAELNITSIDADEEVMAS